MYEHTHRHHLVHFHLLQQDFSCIVIAISWKIYCFTFNSAKSFDIWYLHQVSRFVELTYCHFYSYCDETHNPKYNAFQNVHIFTLWLCKYVAGPKRQLALFNAKPENRGNSQAVLTSLIAHHMLLVTCKNRSVKKQQLPLVELQIVIFTHIYDCRSND